MAFVAPQIIPKKKENGGQGLSNWRSSPGLKPNTSPKPLPIDAVPALTLGEAQYDDYLVSITLPAGTAREAVERVLLPEAGYATSHAYGYLMHIAKPATVPLDREGADGAVDSKNESLSGPALHFKTPKPDLNLVGGAISTPSPATPDTPAAAVNKHGLPAMELPPAAEGLAAEATGTTTEDELFVAVYGTQDAADNAKYLISSAFHGKATVAISTRRRGSTNATLVLKGVPFQTRIDSLVENLSNHLTFRPSYVRLHRSERGVFKCVVFLKFSTRMIAEHAKLELERITVGTRPLRVEFKKQQRDGVVAAPEAPATPAPAPAPAAATPSATVPAPSSAGGLPPPPAYGSHKSPQTLLGLPPPAYAAPTAPPAPPVAYAAMEQALSAVVLGDTGGCVYASSDLKPEDVRYLSHLCAVSGLQMLTATPSNVPSEANISLLPTSSSALGSSPKAPDFILIRKRPPPSASPAAPAAFMDRNSPQFGASATPKFTPRIVPSTPQWVAHTPSSLQPMDFRGIRHWKEMRQEATAQVTANTGATLGIIRPLGPEGAAPFGSGRGRPVR